MIAYLLTCSLSALAGWFGHRAWVKAHPPRRMIEYAVRLKTPYEIALAEYDRQITAARSKHLKVQHIMDARKAFVASELRRTINDYRDAQQASPEQINRMMRGAENAAAT